MIIYELEHERLEEGFNQFDYNWETKKRLLYLKLETAVKYVYDQAYETGIQLPLQSVKFPAGTEIAVRFQLGDTYRWTISPIKVIE